jgi:hypothetical protein
MSISQQMSIVTLLLLLLKEMNRTEYSDFPKTQTVRVGARSVDESWHD